MLLERMKLPLAAWLALYQPGLSLPAGRETVSFNFGWRFHLGDPPTAPPACAITDFENITTDCSGTFYAPLHSQIDCMKACCPGSGYHPNCSVWSWCDSDDPAHWKENVTCGCYLGDATTAKCPGRQSQIKWSGGRRTVPWPDHSVSPYASPDLSDSDWEPIDAPHDFVIANNFSPAATDGGQHGYLERELPGYYRKHFRIPADWSSSNVKLWLRFNGVFHTSQAWLDGIPLPLGAGSLSGYTAFTAPLPDQLAAGNHVLALRVDASFGSGHWYEGGGIFRDCFIIAAHTVHVVEDGLFAPADGNVVKAQVEIINEGQETVTVLAAFTAWDNQDVVAATGSSDTITLYPGETRVVHHNLHVPTPKQWSIQSPNLYTIGVALSEGHTVVLLDAVNVTTGFRSAVFTADSGFHLNDIRTPLRGFSNHNDMSGVGSAVPARMNLYRVQMLRAVGGNIWRMSHNPGDPAIFDLFDRVGLMSWDENRDYGKYQSVDMRDMVRRDRNHPSIIVWSLCNEIECTEASAAQGDEFRNVTLAEDPTRPVSANLLHDSSGTMVSHLDVLGISHASTVPYPYTPQGAGWYDPRYSYSWFHQHHNSIPMVSSESTSCNTQRGVNIVNGTIGEWDDSFNGDCLAKVYCPPNTSKAVDENITGAKHAPGRCTQSWTLAYSDDGNLLPFFAGNLGVWTLFDYYGEPDSSNRGGKQPGEGWTPAVPNWPQVSCNFGSFDLAGFPKPAAYHYRSWWLANLATTDMSRPPVTGGADIDVVRIVHDWREPAPPIVAVYSNLPFVELFLNGKSLGTKRMAWAAWTQWDPKFVPGNLTAVAYDANGIAKARHTSLTPGPAQTLSLTIDAPAVATGTGEALLLDGQDAAMLRASVLDAHGNLASGLESFNISFTVIAGPGRVSGVGNGSPVSHERNKGSSCSTYHGLARAIIQTTLNAASTDRGRLAEIDIDSSRSAVLLDSTIAPTEIVVQATAPGLPPARASIPVSTDVRRHSVNAAAARNAHTNIDIS